MSFHVREKEIVGLVGESGSGKTLTAMSVAQLLPGGVGAAAQTLRIGGRDIASSAADQRYLATRLGLVFQGPLAYFNNPCLRIGRQLTEVSRVHVGLSRRDRNQLAEHWLETLRVTQPRKRLTQFVEPLERVALRLGPADEQLPVGAGRRYTPRSRSAMADKTHSGEAARCGAGSPGSFSNAIAIIARCRMPPDSSCGNRMRRNHGSLRSGSTRR